MSEEHLDKHICPRRSESFDIKDETPTDIWKISPVETVDIHRYCSYCGSMHPDDFFSSIDRGDELGPTDKNYKVYVGSSSRQKFYFLHLNQSQQLKFIDLLNNKKLNIGYPGRFYVMPFFIMRG